MSQSYLLHKSQLWPLLTDQLDAVHRKKSIKLANLPGSKLVVSDIIEVIKDFVNSYNPPLELERLSLQSCQLSEISGNFSSFSSSIKYLDLHQNNVHSISESIISCFPSLEILDLSSNNLSTLPGNLSQLKNLRIISIRNNKFKYLPPVLAELPSINLMEIAENPLVVPSLELIRSLQKSNSDYDWILELKSYLMAHKSLLDFKIQEQQQNLQKQSQPLSAPPALPNGQQPMLTRPKSISDKSKASRAARRMGLLIKREDASSPPSSADASSVSIHDSTNDTFASSGVSNANSTLDDTTASFPFASQAQTNGNHTSNSPTSIAAPISKTANASVASSNTTRNRSRSNTLKEIDRILEKNDKVDTEHKSGAYFRRLSTLQEIPGDKKDVQSENVRSIQNSQTTKTNEDTITKTHSAANRTAPAIVSNDISPSRTNPVAVANKKHSISSIVKVSRKVLFSFSELHSSVRRFTGFCADKKVTMKMVSLLYTTKSNIDSLVENLEIMEETGTNLDQIVASLHVCISSFKAIMTLLSENFASFVDKIDVCFIRMLYLTLYGSFNELLNAYRTLFNVPVTAAATESTKQKLSINTTHFDHDDVDEKLYVTIDSATTTAQNIFSELNKAINKSAIASASSSDPATNASVANKVNELTNVCVSFFDITKRLKTKLITIRNNPSQTTKKSFGEDINLFIKSIVQTLACVKGIVKDLPILDDIRASMSTLTKTAKEVTYMLEVSSYKTLATDSTGTQYPPALVSIPSVSNLFTPVSAHPPLQSPSSVNLAQLASNGNMGVTRTPLTSSLTASSIKTPGLVNGHNIGPLTAPTQSSGQYYAKNGMNPFDGLIMASRNHDREIVDAE
ncbi:predicted protein [Scheffersomyces stipitis CBS 6054]|uniref:Leucine-rich repeat-containing protein SOG2 n=1 Tax=Scheffersomyces stipitis (strain ATCC 58785 / CBS 6054 / NBRC 10063 / NRRL Y-11545) TaxID=322104 RepID=A3LWZ6_PICST|nr:predicted protein [Scheffersomyces stipitis CBS 6054]ABN67372.2 predicted protein [Scheffersomyces stipitis CBS 6054]